MVRGLKLTLMMYENNFPSYCFDRPTLLEKERNTIILKRIRQLLEVIQQQRFKGIGKPESLKYQWAGKWSRRINQ